MGWIIAILIGGFLLRLVFVLGRTKAEISQKSADNREIYSLCKAMGMSFGDIQSVENNQAAMTWVKNRIETRHKSADDSRNQLIAKTFREAKHIIDGERLVLPLIFRSLEAGIHQFSRHLPAISKDTTVFPMIPVDILSEIWGTRKVEAFGGVKFLPDEMFRLPHLEKIVLGKGGYPGLGSCELKELPESLVEAKNLKAWHLQYCGIEVLPDYLFTPWVEEIKIGGNEIKCIPDSIGNAASLKLLTAWSNDIECVSPQIGKLKKLKRLDFFSNDRLRLPDTIVELGIMDEVQMPFSDNYTEEQIEWMKLNGLSNRL